MLKFLRPASQRYAGVAAMRDQARRRMPGFAFDFMEGGINHEAALLRNRRYLDDYVFEPRYLIDSAETQANLGSQLFGQTYSVPFGITPIGLSGLMWPMAARTMARMASRSNLPFCLSAFATSGLEAIAEINQRSWFQIYIPSETVVLDDLIDRLKESAYETLVVTLDIPTVTRREKDVQNGLSVPPSLDWHNLKQMILRPGWSIGQLKRLRLGKLDFPTMAPYVPKGHSWQQKAEFYSQIIEGRVNCQVLVELRKSWPGKLIAKGIMTSDDALIAHDLGVDAVWVSNHGGRQLDACRSPMEVLKDIRQVLGNEYPILADSGCRSGLDIVRMLHAGANLVMLGRPFLYSLGALGEQGPKQLVEIFQEEVRMTMAQIGAQTLADLGPHLSGQVVSRPHF